MQRTRGIERYLAAGRILLLGAGLFLGAMQTCAEAQTVLSPTPIVPISNRAGSSLDIPDPDSEDEEDGPVDKIFHIPLILNESVESQIEYFTTRGRGIFQAWLDRSARYLPLMKKIFREYNLPEDLVYVAMIESGFNPHAVSPKKAVGQWQFMRATGREYGLNTNPWVDERRDPIKATRAAAAHLKDLYNTFGSWLMALASYNAGTGRIQGAVLKGRSDDFWELSASRFIRIETQEYVPRYLAALIISKNPVAYGFTDPDEEPFEYEEIVIQKSTDLRSIARYAGSSYEEIRDLNPELLQYRTPQARYVLRIPPGTKTSCQQQLASATVRERKLRADRDRARSGGLLFTRLAEAEPKKLPSPSKTDPIVSVFAAQLDSLHPHPGTAGPSEETSVRVLR